MSHLFISASPLQPGQFSFWELITFSIASLFHGANNNNLFFPLASCLLISCKEQMPEFSRMAVNWMPLQEHLLQSMSPPTPNSPISHVTQHFQEVARLEPVPLQPKSLGCLVGSVIPASGIHIPKELKGWDKASPQRLASLYPKSLKYFGGNPIPRLIPW